MFNLDISYSAFVEAIVIAVAISIDVFLGSFAYGSNKIKIPFISTQVINVICTFFIVVALLTGSIIKVYIPEWLIILLGFSILFILGIIKFLDSIVKSLIKKYNNYNKELSFSFLNLKFIINLYANPTDADVDDSKSLSPKEAISLGVAVGLDGLGVGFAAALGSPNIVMVMIMSLIVGMIAIFAGGYFGNKIARTLKFNLSWLSGLLLIILAFTKLF